MSDHRGCAGGRDPMPSPAGSTSSGAVRVPHHRPRVTLLCLALVAAAVVGPVALSNGQAGAVRGRLRAGSGATSVAPVAGAFYAWGDNDAGQLGVGVLADAANKWKGDSLNNEEWVHMPAGSQTVAMAAGQSHSLAVTTAGSVFATGYNADGQLGTGNRTATVSPVATALPAGVRATAAAAGYKQSMALSAAGAVYTWGSNLQGQAGIGSAAASIVSPTEVPLPAGTTVSAIAAGTDHDLAVTSTGAVYAWGLNSTGQLGDGSTASSSLPVPVQLPPGVIVTAVAGGAGHSLALTSTGVVYAWGDDTHGQLGDGANAEEDTPVTVDLPAGVTVTAIAAGDGDPDGLTGGYSLALTSTGVVYAWGDNASDDLGDGSTTDSSVPVPVQVPAGVIPTQISAGGNRCHLLSTAGTLYDWGSGEKPGTDVHPVPTLDPNPAGMTPVAIADGPAAEQYLSIMDGSALEVTGSVAPATYHAAGQDLGYSFTATNTGSTSISEVDLSSDGAAPLDCHDGDPTAKLDPSASVTCTSAGFTTQAEVDAGSTSDSASATATAPGGASLQAAATVTAKASQTPSVGLVALVNGASDPSVPAGSSLTWDLDVSNPGNVTLQNLAITDRKLPTAAIDCPGGDNVVASLAPGDAVTCTATGTAITGRYQDTATVTAEPPAGVDVSATSADGYAGYHATLRLTEQIDGEQGTASVDVGSPVDWQLVVTNTGTGPAPLSEVTVTDSEIADSAISCRDGSDVVASLGPGDSVTCTATASAAEGRHDDQSMATATTPDGQSISASAEGSYVGTEG